MQNVSTEYWTSSLYRNNNAGHTATMIFNGDLISNVNSNKNEGEYHAKWYFLLAYDKVTGIDEPKTVHAFAMRTKGTSFLFKHILFIFYVEYGKESASNVRRTSVS